MASSKEVRQERAQRKTPQGHTAWRIAILTLLPIGAHVQKHTDREIKQTIPEYME